MVKYYKKKRPKTHPVLKKSVCVILPRIDLNEFLRKKKKSLTKCNEIDAGNSSPNSPLEQVRLKTKRRLRIKKEKTCIFHHEVDIQTVEDANSSERSYSLIPLSHLHEINQSMCYMCGPVQESKAEVWNEIRRLQNTTENTQENRPEDEALETQPEILITESQMDDVPENQISESDPRSTAEVTSQAVQTDVNLYSCKYCPSLFSNLEYLLHHKTVHAQFLTCVLCPANFVKKNDLQAHMKLHEQRKYYECVYCHQCFKKKGDFKMHLTLHNDERVYRCASCPAAFAQSSQLRDHQRLHKSESSVRKFIHIFRKVDDISLAESDRMVTSAASSVEAVESVESVESVEPVEPTFECNTTRNVRPSGALNFYTCEKCTVNFKTLLHYKKHMLCHTRNNGNFVCKYCSGRFLRSVALYAHQRYAHTNFSI